MVDVIVQIFSVNMSSWANLTERQSKREREDDYININIETVLTDEWIKEQRVLKIQNFLLPQHGLLSYSNKTAILFRLWLTAQSKTDDLRFLERFKRAEVCINQLNVSCTFDLESRLECGHSKRHERGCKTFYWHLIYTASRYNRGKAEMISALWPKNIFRNNKVFILTLKLEHLYSQRSKERVQHMHVPRWPVSCLDGRPARSWWRRSLRKPCSQCESYHHSPLSAQTPPTHICAHSKIWSLYI